MDDIDYDDGDYGDRWFETDEHYVCSGCGHVGPALGETEQETQGDGPWSGQVTFDTGNRRCAECDDDEKLTAIPKAITDAVKALLVETVYEGGAMANGIAVKFLARMTVLRAAAGFKTDAALLEDAQRVLV